MCDSCVHNSCGIKRLFVFPHWVLYNCYNNDSYGYAEMVGWGARKEKTRIHEETDQDATDSCDPCECVWVCRRGTNGWVVCVILRSVFLLPSKWQWLSSRCRTDSCCHTHTTCQLSWSDNVLFNEANWETSQYAAVSACVCAYWCVSWTSSVSCWQ